MKTQTTMFFIAVFFILTINGCAGKLDNFDDVRDYIMNESGESFRTTFEFAVKTDNLGIIRDHVKDLDFDTGDYKVSGIEKVEIGMYRVRDDETVRLTDNFELVDVKKMTQRLRRAGYETIIRSTSADEISLGLIKESRGSRKGAGYFIQLKPDQFVVVKVDADFSKL